MGENSNKSDDPPPSSIGGSSSTTTSTTTTTNAPEAKQMFVLMKRDFRISRNVRAQWYFQHLNKTVKLQKGDTIEESSKESSGPTSADEDLEVLGALPEMNPSIDTYKLTPNSLVYFLSKRYRLVFILDYSPSTAVVDAEQNCVLHDRVFLAFRNFLMGLVQPFRIPSRNEVMAPQFYITVLAYTPFLKNRGRQALLQGCLVNLSNLHASIRHVEVALQRFLRGVTEASVFSDQALAMSPDRHRARSKFIVPSDSALIDMIRFGMLAVQLLPENTSAGMIVFTDGVLGLPDSAILEALLSQLRVWTISCSFALVRRDGGSPDYAFGKVPNTELMRFLASATFGVHLEDCPNVGPSLEKRLNLYHKAVLCWSFQRALEDYSHSSTILSPYSQLPCQLVRIRNFSNLLATSLQAVLAVRLREGYTVKRVAIGDKQIKMELMLPWKYEVNLEYTIVSDWPLSKHGTKVKVELFAEGPYEFINDLTAPKWNQSMSPYRALACRTYVDSMQNVIQADKMLVHFNSFRTSPVFYTLPEPVKNGVPLFYMLADSEAPVVSSVELQHQQYHAFCQYWRPICILDMNVWQKWLHTHRISLLLTHDTPLSPHLHTASRTNGRFGTVSCRLSVTAIDNALKQWATFTLMDNHSYIKFEFEDPESKIPSFFYIIRPSFKPPCIVIRLAFLGGICGAVRNKIMAELTERLLSLQVSQRYLSSSAPSSGVRSPSKASQLVSDQLIPVKACHQLKKPVEKILVRYDRIPKDLFHMVHFDDLGRSSATLNSVLCRYLHCKRYLWSLKRSAPVLPMNAESASFVLQTLVSRRLNDGFRFAYSCDGFLTLFKEYEVNECPFTTCSVQYVVFPPFSSSCVGGGGNGCGSMTRDSVRSDNEHSEMESTEADTDALLVTELWIEPQYGFLRTSADDQQQAATRLDLFEQLYQIDRDIIRCLVTFEHVKIACTARYNGGRSRRLCWRSLDKLQRSRSGSLDADEILSPTPTITKSMTNSTMVSPLMEADQSVVVVPSCFHVSTLLAHSQLITLLFSSLRNSGHSDDANVSFFDSLNRELKQAYDIYWLIDSYDELHDVWMLINERHLSISKPFQSRIDRSMKWMKNVRARLELTKLVGSGGGGNNHQVQQQPHRLPKLNCYARLLADCRLTIVLCPASFEDVQLLWTPTMVEEESGKGGQLSGEPDGSYSFPLLAFNCCHALLSSALSGEFETPSAIDGSPMRGGGGAKSACHEVQMEDFRSGRRSSSVLSEFHRGIMRRISDSDDDAPLIRKAHERTNSCCESINIGAYCSYLENIYAKAFVDGVYRALLSNSPIHASDIFSVVDAKCEESVVGVELTQFLRSACRHWHSNDVWMQQQQAEKGSTTRRSTMDSSFTLRTYDDYSVDESTPEAFQSPPCSTQFHKTVQEAFREVLHRSFKPIADCADYYYYSPPVEFDEPVSEGDSFSAASQEFDDQQAEVTFGLDDSPSSRVFRQPQAARASAGTVSTATRRTRTTTSFSSADDQSGSCDSLSALVNDSWRTPVFLHLACSVRLRGVLYSCSVQELPVCLVTLFRDCDFDGWDDEELWANLDVQLDLMALTPQKVEEDEIFTATDNDSWGENEDLDAGRRVSQSLEPSDTGITQILDGVKEEVTLLLESEVVFSYGRHDDVEVTEMDLRNVMTHIGKLSGKCLPSSNCGVATIAVAGSKINHLPLSFVMKEVESLRELKSQLRNLVLSETYRLAECDRESNLYYATSKQPRRRGSEAKHRLSAYAIHLNESARSQSFSGFSNVLYAKRESLLAQMDGTRMSLDDVADMDEDGGGGGTDTADMPRRWSDAKHRRPKGTMTPGANSDIFVEVKGPEEKAEEDEEETDVVRELIGKERTFRDFWLIVGVSPACLSAYLLERISGSYNEIWVKLISELQSIIKRVNQTMLLQNLFETRLCDNLLAQEREDRLWKRPSAVSNDGSESDYEITPTSGYLAASSQFVPGYFSCPCVNYHWFNIHPRLKAGVGRGGLNRATQAMQTLLNKFAVMNRENMFVYKESTGAVFYLRLHEKSQSASVALSSLDESKLEALQETETGAEPSTVKRMDSPAIGGAASVKKKFSMSKWAAKQCQDKVLLTVHGVQASSGEIVGQLVPALQHRLDDAVLDALLVTLERNPTCKLTLEDVQFLQPPETDATCLRFYVLPPIVLQHLYSFSYYLQQHLLEFCFKPNYASHEAKFRLYTESKSLSPVDNGLFLYHPRTASAKGVAVLSYAYVGADGYALPILSAKALEPLEGFSAFFRSGFSFETLTSVVEFDTMGRKRAMPPTLLQFAVWERGEVGIQQLSAHLEKSIRRAICDLVTEYGLLTAPLLEGTLLEGALSEPGSPTLGKESYETTISMPLRKRHSSAAMHLAGQRQLGSNASASSFAPCSALAVAAPVPGIFSFENLHALMRKATDAQPPTSHSSSNEVRRRHNSQQTAAGVFRGGIPPGGGLYAAEPITYLNTAYADQALRWFDFVHRECGSSCVQRWTFTLETEYCRLLVLREVVEAMRRLLEPDMDVLCFAETARPMGVVVYESYKPTRPPVVVVDEVELTSLDEKHATPSVGGNVGDSFVVVGFSSALWKDTMRFGRSVSYGSAPDSISAIVKSSSTNRVLQRFPPLVPSGAIGFVPRQRLFQVAIKGRQITAYAYNCISDMNNLLERALLRLIAWHNARSRLLSQVCLQKMGLFQVPIYNEAEAKENPYYLFAWPEAESFVSSNLPPTQLAKLKPQPQLASPYKPERWEWWQYLNLISPSDQRGGFDPVAVHGMRFLQFRNSFLRQKDDMAILRSVFHHLSRLKKDMEACLDEELLRIVIARSRLVHTVYTPLLFSPVWREKLSSVRRPSSSAFPTTPPSPVTATRSRHDSGPTAPMVSANRVVLTTASGQQMTIQQLSSVIAGGGGGVVGAPLSPVLVHKTPATLFTTGVESWHAEVQRMMLQHYVRYLCEHLGLRILSRKPRQGDVKTSTGPASNHQNHHDIEAWAYSLSSTVVTFIRCFYSEPYFAVHFYVFDASTLVPDLDTDEDESADDLTDTWTNLVTQSHLHSFSYDFHMRLVASYASGERKNVFKPGYNMNAFLVDFLQYYTCRPPFARTYVFEDRLFVHGMTVSTDQLYNHILDHDILYGLRVVRMRVSVSNADEQANEYLLTSHAKFLAPAGAGSGEVPFQVLYLVMRNYENVDAWKDWLSLKFYVIFVDQTNVFPQCTGSVESGDHGKYHRVRTPSWAVGGETSFGEDGGRSTGRQTLRSVESAPCRVDAQDRFGAPSSSLRISRRSISRDSRDAPPLIERTVSFSTTVVTATEATSSSGSGSNFSPTTIQECSSYFPVGVAAMAHNRTAFGVGSMDEQISCMDVVDLSEDSTTMAVSLATEVKTHSRTRSSADEYFAAVSERGTPIRRRMPTLRPIEGTSLHTEQVTYLTYVTDDEFNMQKCLAEEAGKFKEKLINTLRDAASHCKRDLLWQKLLSGVAGSEVGASKKKEDHTGIPLREFELVLKSVHSIPLASIDSSLESLLNIPVSWLPTLSRALQQKYHCRHFVSQQDVGKQYLAVLNSNYLDSFILIAVDKNSAYADVRLVYKDYSAVTAEPSSSAVGGKGAAESRLYRHKTIQGFCENFVQTLIFHQWTKLLP